MQKEKDHFNLSFVQTKMKRLFRGMAKKRKAVSEETYFSVLTVAA